MRASLTYRFASNGAKTPLAVLAHPFDVGLHRGNQFLGAFKQDHWAKPRKELNRYGLAIQIAFEIEDVSLDVRRRCFLERRRYADGNRRFERHIADERMSAVYPFCDCEYVIRYLEIRR